MNQADSVWDFMLLMLWLFFLVSWLLLLFSIIGDLFRDHETSGFTKFLWCAFILLLPFLGVLVYVIVRGTGMARRGVEARVRAQQELDSYVRQVAGSTGDPVTQIADAKALLDAGAIDQVEFERLKGKALA